MTGTGGGLRDEFPYKYHPYVPSTVEAPMGPRDKVKKNHIHFAIERSAALEQSPVDVQITEHLTAETGDYSLVLGFRTAADRARYLAGNQRQLQHRPVITADPRDRPESPDSP